YKDRDWDAYRNHSIGFVFQSYNLIPHQTVLANVELALTISGVRRAERKRRAREALEAVGLGEHLHKKPNQLSGGQMQRVAIARALVNDPDILLADEPTGALDSETSVQVMELLKEVAKDRLVVMVTHNPELAAEYATRTVHLKDGRITDDTDPYVPPAVTEPPVHKNMGRASMSPLTSLALSFNNLRTKLTRTLLTALAGSIGIIGIALIASLSNGADLYIQSVERDTLKSYPLEITASGFDLSAMMGGQSSADSGKEPSPDKVREMTTVTGMLSLVTTNDLPALRDYLESGQCDIRDQVVSIEYGYDLTPRIYSLQGGKARQVNPDNSFAALGFSASDSAGSFFSSYRNTDSFYALPVHDEVYKEQFEVKAGRWTQAPDECVVVLTSDGRITDLTLYTLGLKDASDLDRMIRDFAEGREVRTDGGEREYDYGDFLGVEFRYVCPASFYEYDPAYSVWTDRSADAKWLYDRLTEADALTVVGVVQPLKDSGALTLNTGIGYDPGLRHRLMELAAGERIVKQQLRDPDTNVFTGAAFGAETGTDFDLANLFSLDEDALADAFRFDASAFSLDLSGLSFDFSDLKGVDLDMSGLEISAPSVSAGDLASLFDGIELSLTAEQLQGLFSEVVRGFAASAAEDPATDLSRLPEGLRSFLTSEEAKEILTEQIRELLRRVSENAVTAEELRAMAQTIADGFEDYAAQLELEENEPALRHFDEYLESGEVRSLLEAEAASIRTRIAGAAISPEEIKALAEALNDAYERHAEENGYPVLSAMLPAFEAYMGSEPVQTRLREQVRESIHADALEQRAAELFTGLAEDIAAQIGTVISGAVGGMMEQLSGQLTAQMGTLFGQMERNFSDLFTMDTDTLAKAFAVNMDAQSLQELLTALMSRERSSYESNLRTLGYATDDDLTSITIYPVDFDGKARVKEEIEKYNQMVLDRGEDGKVISYTDLVDTMMNSVTTIINAISAVLIAFVSVSLVVSSIMIGIITYISVLERTKEIGILRAIGASKRNISQVFNAETFLIGLCAGLLGVGISLALIVPANQIIHHFTGNSGVNAVLPAAAGVILVVLSIVLTLIGGLIPSRKAARKDPVTALRTE
ncbi:MAG: ATP-binding cassette domain-containing protein, partial [Oscillospiraceae bacterium]|nr:ATP-binding cassette domain-containing protein [Oscillospiraceae bacterium]